VLDSQGYRQGQTAKTAFWAFSGAPNSAVIAISVGDERNDADLKGSPFEFLHDRLFLREELANVAQCGPSASVIHEMEREVRSINER
jgi:hypothetical protein